jgi:hypothetical protein
MFPRRYQRVRTTAVSPPTVFLSAASADLQDWRDVLHTAFSRAGCMVFTQDQSLAASAGGVLRLLRQHLDKSDFVIHIAGMAYGAEPEEPAFPSQPGFKCSYTQFEYYYAHQQDKQVIAFVCAERFPYKPFIEKATNDDQADRERRRLLQVEHRKRVAQGGFAGTPLDGHPVRPLSESLADSRQLLQAVAGAVGTIRDFSVASVAAVQNELNALATERHDALMTNLADLPSRVADELIRRQVIRPPTAAFYADISRIIKYAPTELIGREAETKFLSDTWDQAVRGAKRRPHVLTFVALGGGGKTSLVAKWAADLAYQGWPGCDAVFAWSFYSQGTGEQTTASSDLLLKEALTVFGDPAMASSAQSAYVKGRRLAQLVGERRALLILDGLEPLQYAPTAPTPGELKDHGISALLKGLASHNRGLCVVTTRYSLPDLKAFWQTTAPEHELKSLSIDAGVELLRKLGVKGSHGELEDLVMYVDAHALTLNLLGSFLKRAFKGDVRQRGRVKFEKANEKVQGGHAFRAMAAYEEWLLQGGDEGRREVAILRLTGLFDRPADDGCIKSLRGESIPGLTEPIIGLEESDWEFCLTGLEEAKLLTVHRNAAGALLSLDAHPLLREYFAQGLRTNQPEAWRAAHRRLYEHLCKTAKDSAQPTLEELQPLYQAVAHGCHAGMSQETCDNVYNRRIAGHGIAYSTKQLGAASSDLGAISCFFEQPWSRVLPSLRTGTQAWLFNEAAYRLEALGRLTEALEPMHAGLEMRVEQRDWENATRSATNLRGVELGLGAMQRALMTAEQSVTYADRTSNVFLQSTARAGHADALYQAGRQAEAAARFHEAETMQVRKWPQALLLYSSDGFRYCDLLLGAPERVAWQLTLGLSCSARPSSLVESCHAVSKRTAWTIRLAEFNNWPLDVSLDNLTLGRAALYEMILESASLDPCRSPIQKAVDGFRRYGGTRSLPLALCARAWLRSLTGARTGADSAKSDLDEAWEIAERSPMKLDLADIHLHRARLLFRETPYPWESPQDDLDAAEGLIESCGYHRRDEELADAKRVILG